MINKNISVWRGNQNPPTEYHLWLNSEGKLLAKINEQWELISGDDIPLASDTVDGLMSAADKAKLDSVDIAAIQAKNLEQDNRLANVEELNTKQNERLLNYVYPKLYQINEGAGALPFDGMYSGSASVLSGRKTAAEEGHTYKIVFALGKFLLQDISPDGTTIGLYEAWDKIISGRGSSEDYTRRDCLYFIYVEGKGNTYYYIDGNGVATEQSATYLLRRLVDKNVSEIAKLKTITENSQNKLSNYADTFAQNPVASSESNGLMSTSDFTSLKDNTTKIQSIWEGNPALVSPTISVIWHILDLNGSRITTSSSNSITYEKGYKANFTGGWKWVEAEGKKNPTRTDGSWGTILPSSNNESGPLSIKNITTNTTISLNLYAPKLGLMVSGSNVAPASGEDKTTASASVTFKDRLYYGVVSSSTPTESNIKALTNELVSSRAKTISNITASLYYCYAYPQSLGALTKITLDGATPVLGAFTLKTLTITNAAGLSVALYVYVSNNPGAFTNNELKFE